LFLFNQGPAKGLGNVRFHNYQPTFDSYKDLPNVAIFIKQIELFKEFLTEAYPDQKQDMDSSFSLPLGEMFSIVVYGQLILEQSGIENLDKDIINQVFDFMVRDFASFALQIYGMNATRADQRDFCREIMQIRTVGEDEQVNRVWEKYVFPLNGEYQMND
jgi:acyl-CoA dehydrogenase